METTTATEVRNAQLAHAATLARMAAEAMAEVEYLLKLAEREEETKDLVESAGDQARAAKDRANDVYTALWNYRL
jgi:hypothetical protein